MCFCLVFCFCVSCVFPNSFLSAIVMHSSFLGFVLCATNSSWTLNAFVLFNTKFVLCVLLFVGSDSKKNMEDVDSSDSKTIEWEDVIQPPAFDDEQTQSPAFDQNSVHATVDSQTQPPAFNDENLYPLQMHKNASSAQQWLDDVKLHPHKNASSAQTLDDENLHPHKNASSLASKKYWDPRRYRKLFGDPQAPSIASIASSPVLAHDPAAPSIVSNVSSSVSVASRWFASSAIVDSKYWRQEVMQIHGREPYCNLCQIRFGSNGQEWRLIHKGEEKAIQLRRFCVACVQLIPVIVGSGYYCYNCFIELDDPTVRAEPHWRWLEHV